MELAQHSQEVQPLAEQPAQAAGVQGEQPGTAAQPEPARTHLAAVPALEQPAQQESEAAEPPRAAPPRRMPPPRARPLEEEPKATKTDGPAEQRHGDGEGPSIHQVRRFRTMWRQAETPEEKASALRFGEERGIPEALELLRLLRDQKASADTTPKAGEAQPPKVAEQPAQHGGATAQAGTQAAAGAAPAQPPAEPKHMGQSRAALAAHAEQGKWLADLAEGLGKMVGWEAPPSEPMDLFEGVPGFEAIKDVKGNPRKRLAELVTVELAAMSTKAGGEQDSPMKRRAEIGMLVLGTAGPGLLPFAAKLLGGGLSKLTQVSGALAGVVRRWRR